jgi:NADPH2:quinone reductase
MFSPENEPARTMQVWTELLELLASGKVTPVVYEQVYTLETLVQGLDDLEKRKTWGKAIVMVRQDGKSGQGTKGENEEQPRQKAKL